MGGPGFGGRGKFLEFVVKSAERFFRASWDELAILGALFQAILGASIGHEIFCASQFEASKPG